MDLEAQGKCSFGIQGQGRGAERRHTQHMRTYYIYVYTYMCIYIYIYTYAHIYTYISIYVYIGMNKLVTKVPLHHV